MPEADPITAKDERREPDRDPDQEAERHADLQIVAEPVASRQWHSPWEITTSALVINSVVTSVTKR